MAHVGPDMVGHENQRRQPSCSMSMPREDSDIEPEEEGDGDKPLERPPASKWRENCEKGGPAGAGVLDGLGVPSLTSELVLTPTEALTPGVPIETIASQSAEQFHVSYQLHQWITVTSFASLVMLPFVVNTIWLSTGNFFGCGSEGQDFWWFTLVYDLYFMLVKGSMISMYFYIFMPDVIERCRPMVYSSHALFAALSVTIGVSMNIMWRSLGVYDEGGGGWHYHKLNLPASILGGCFLWGAPHILVMWRDWQALKLATLRFLLLSFVIVGDLIFVASSLAYVWLVFYLKSNPLELSWLFQTGLELALVNAFGSLYMPLLGKIWWVAILLIDSIAPMDDLMRQRLFHFATLILDMHRIMYARQIFSAISEFWIFAAVVLKDVCYDLYQFGIKSDEAYIATVLHLWHPKGMQIIPGWRVLLFKSVECWARLLGPSKQMMAAFHLKINAGFPSEGTASEDGSVEPERAVRFYFCDHVLHVYNLANSYAWGEEERDFSIRDSRGSQLSDRNRSDRDLQKKVAELHQKVSKGLKQGMKEAKDFGQGCFGQSSPNPREAQTHKASPAATLVHLVGPRSDSPLDLERAVKMVAVGDKEQLSEGHFEATQNFLGIEAWRILFMKHVILRIQGLMCIRYRTRLLVRYLSALNFGLTQYFLRASPSRHVMNFILDNSQEMYNELWLKAVLFIAADIFAGFVITTYHSRNQLARQFGDWRHRRIFGSTAFTVMIVVCTMCCNTDIYLTFPDLKFCE